MANVHEEHHEMKKNNLLQNPTEIFCYIYILCSRSFSRRWLKVIQSTDTYRKCSKKQMKIAFLLCWIFLYKGLLLNPTSERLLYDLVLNKYEQKCTAFRNNSCIKSETKEFSWMCIILGDYRRMQETAHTPQSYVMLCLSGSCWTGTGLSLWRAIRQASWSWILFFCL